jgi:hypothetical protein
MPEGQVLVRVGQAGCSSSSYYINNRQPNGSLSNVLSRLAVVVRVDGDELEHLNLKGWARVPQYSTSPCSRLLHSEVCRARARKYRGSDASSPSDPLVAPWGTARGLW